MSAGGPAGGTLASVPSTWGALVPHITPSSPEFLLLSPDGKGQGREQGAESWDCIGAIHVACPIHPLLGDNSGETKPRDGPCGTHVPLGRDCPKGLCKSIPVENMCSPPQKWGSLKGKWEFFSRTASPLPCQGQWALAEDRDFDVLGVAEVGSQAGPSSVCCPWELLVFLLSQPGFQLFPAVPSRRDEEAEGAGPNQPPPPSWPGVGTDCCCLWALSSLADKKSPLLPPPANLCGCGLSSQDRLVLVSCTGKQKEPSFLSISRSEPKTD